jgi:hypothetical protein
MCEIFAAVGAWTHTFLSAHRNRHRNLAATIGIRLRVDYNLCAKSQNDPILDEAPRGNGLPLARVPFDEVDDLVSLCLKMLDV